MRTARHKVPRPRSGGEGMRRVGEANAEPTRRWVRGNFHITLTPALSLREGEGVVALPHRVPSPPFPGERAQKGESPN